MSFEHDIVAADFDIGKGFRFCNRKIEINAKRANTSSDHCGFVEIKTYRNLGNTMGYLLFLCSILGCVGVVNLSNRVSFLFLRLFGVEIHMIMSSCPVAMSRPFAT